VIFVGEVLDLEVLPDASPLLFHGGRHRRLLDDPAGRRRSARGAPGGDRVDRVVAVPKHR
jgi:hypothetical protein